MMEIEQTSTHRLVSRLIWLGCGAASLMLVASVATPAVRRLMTRAPEPLPAPMTDQTPPHWSAEQVGELIDGIEDARRAGLEPADYGIAALRGELARHGGPSLAEGSVQFDRLAETSALVLAEDLSRHGRADHAQFDWHAEDRARNPKLATALHAALARGRLRAWLVSLRAPSPWISSSHAN